MTVIGVVKMYKAIISAHMWLDDKGYADVEILSQIDNDNKGTDIFDSVEDALLEEIDIGGNEDYYFIAIVKANFLTITYPEGVEYEVEYEVMELKTIKDLEDHD